MNQCPNDFDDERIDCNRKARGALLRNCCGSGDGGNGGRGGGCGGSGSGRGGSDGRGGGRGGNYVQVNFSSTAKNETVSVVNGKEYDAYKDCGWNSGNRSYTSGVHEISSMSEYSVTFALKTKMNNLLGAAKGDSGGDRTNDSGDGNGGMNSLAATMMEICFII